MSKSKLFSSLVLASLLFSSAAIAATAGTVTLSGEVLELLEITAVDTAGAGALVLTGGQKIVQVSDIAMTTNNQQGLTLTATSSTLTKVGGTSISFQVTSVADGAGAPIAGGFGVASGTNYTVGTGAAGPTAVDLYIMYTPAALQDPGVYAGSINLTVTDNA